MTIPPIRTLKGPMLVALTVALLAGACSTSSDASEPSTTKAPTSRAESVSTTTTGDGGSKSSADATNPYGPDAFAAVAKAVDDVVAADGLNGAGLVIVDRDHGVIFDHYTGEIGPDRISLIASASKMLVAGVLMRLDDEGKLDVDAPVAEVVDWGGANPDITPVQLLSNSSGLVGLGSSADTLPYICQYVAQGSLQDCAKTIFTTTGDDASVIPPDTKFRYGGAQWQVAGAVAEIASGRSWAQLIDETYVKPCGLKVLSFNNHYTQMVSPAGPFMYPPQFAGDPATLAATDNPNMEGGAYTTAGDYAKLLLMHLRGGLCGQERVLSKAAVERMHTDRTTPTYGKQVDATTPPYGLGWWVDRDGQGIIQDGGAFGAVPWLDLGRNYGAYLVIENTSKEGQKFADQLRPLIEKVVDEKSGGATDR